jgi:hypothetical protein
MVGAEGTVEERLFPSGYVRVHGELWYTEYVGSKYRQEKAIHGRAGDSLYYHYVPAFPLLSSRTRPRLGVTGRVQSRPPDLVRGECEPQARTDGFGRRDGYNGLVSETFGETDYN